MSILRGGRGQGGKGEGKNQEDDVFLLTTGSWLESQEDVCVIWTNLMLNHFSNGQFFTATNLLWGVPGRWWVHMPCTKNWALGDIALKCAGPILPGLFLSFLSHG